MPAPIPQLEIAQLPADAALLDVREDAEWRAGHIVGALHVPMNTLPNRLGSEPDILDREARLVVVCRSGSRSAQVTAWLIQQGYDAYNLAGGMHAWAAAGKAMVSSDGTPPQVV